MRVLARILVGAGLALSTAASGAPWQVSAVARYTQYGDIKVSATVSDENGAALTALEIGNFQAAIAGYGSNPTFIERRLISQGALAFQNHRNGNYTFFLHKPLNLVDAVSVHVGFVTIAPDKPHHPPQRIFTQRAATVVPMLNKAPPPGQ